MHVSHLRILGSFVSLVGVSAFALLGGACSESVDRQLGSADTELTAAQCSYFDVNGKDTICHHTSSLTHPYTIIKTSEQGCINGHSGHAADYIAFGDPTCQGGGCLPVDAPCDATLPCCDGLTCQGGTCQQNGTSIAGSQAASLSRKADGTVWTSGDNSGDGTTNNHSTPVRVAGLTGVAAVGAGVGDGDADVSLVVKLDGTVWAWGANDHGQLGDGTTVNRTSPVQASGLTGITAVAGGYTSYTLALKSDGTVWSWGWNIYSQLGNVFGPDQLTPAPVVGLSGITAVAAGPIHGLALQSNGTLWAWGYNGTGELGIGVVGGGDIAPTPVLTGVIAMSAGAGFTVALKANGTVWAWGENFHGELGNGSFGPPNPTPTQVPGLAGITALAAGRDEYVLALAANGTVWSWGHNEWGQLGDGTTDDRATPVQVSGLSGVTALAAGRFHSLARTNGAVFAWGANYVGQLGDGTTTQRLAPVPSLLP